MLAPSGQARNNARNPSWTEAPFLSSVAALVLLLKT